VSPHNVCGVFVGSRRNLISEFSDGATFAGMRNDKTSFDAYMFPYKHDHHEYIAGIGG
jgi:hypothetical protein